MNINKEIKDLRTFEIFFYYQLRDEAHKYNRAVAQMSIIKTEGSVDDLDDLDTIEGYYKRSREEAKKLADTFDTDVSNIVSISYEEFIYYHSLDDTDITHEVEDRYIKRKLNTLLSESL